MEKLMMIIRGSYLKWKCKEERGTDERLEQEW